MTSPAAIWLTSRSHSDNRKCIQKLDKEYVIWKIFVGKIFSWLAQPTKVITQNNLNK